MMLLRSHLLKLSLIYRFSNQKRVKFINIKKLLKQEASKKQSTNPQIQFQGYHNAFQKKSYNSQYGQNQNINYFNNGKKADQLSSESQQFIFKIKTSIKSAQIYFMKRKNYSKLLPKHYSLMISKLLEIRNATIKQKEQVQKYQSFLTYASKKVKEMSPQDIIKILFTIKKQGIKGSQIVHLEKILDQIIIQFEDLQYLTKMDPLQPKTSDLITIEMMIKLLHCLLYLLNNTGSHYQAKLTPMLQQILSFFLNKLSNKITPNNKRELIKLKMQLSFLQIANVIELPEQLHKELIKNLLFHKQKLNIEDLLIIEESLFKQKSLFIKLKEEMINSTQAHLFRNLVYKIQRQIHYKLNSTDKSIQYLPLNFTQHVRIMEQFTLKQLEILFISKQQHISKAIQILKNNFNSYFQQKSQVQNKIQNKSQRLRLNQLYGLTQNLVSYFMKLKGQDSQIVKIRKQFHDLLKLLCLNFKHLDFTTSSIIIRYLIAQKLPNLSSIVAQFGRVNMFTVMEKQNEQGKNIYKFHRHKTSFEYFKLMQIFDQFSTDLQHYIKIFIQSSLKYSLRILFRKGIIQNVQQKAAILAKYCGQDTEKIDYIISLYLKGSFTNRSFDEKEVQLMESDIDYFSPNSQFTQKNEQDKSEVKLSGLFKQLQDKNDPFQPHYQLTKKIGYKLRWCLRRFKFVILFLQNITKQNSNNKQQICHASKLPSLYRDLLDNFKKQLQLLKFSKILTIQNLAQIQQIIDFFGDEWNQNEIKALEKGQIYNNQDELNLEDLKKDSLLIQYAQALQQQKNRSLSVNAEIIQQSLNQCELNKQQKLQLQQLLKKINQRSNNIIPILKQSKMMANGNLNSGNNNNSMFQLTKSIEIKNKHSRYQVKLFRKLYFNLSQIGLIRKNNNQNVQILYLSVEKRKFQKRRQTKDQSKQEQTMFKGENTQTKSEFKDTGFKDELGVQVQFKDQEEFKDEILSKSKRIII